MVKATNQQSSWVAGGSLLASVLAAILMLSGCGGSSNPPTGGGGRGQGGGGSQATATQVRMGDAPADRVIAFEFTIGSPILLTPSGGRASVNVPVAANRLELSHMSGHLEPLAVLNVTQGTYLSATITITNSEIIFLDSAGIQHKLQSNTSQIVTVTFSPPLTISATAGTLNLDLSVANSVATDALGNITGFNFSASSFTIGTKAIAAAAEQEDDDGELEDVTGLVTSVSGSNFTISVGQSGAQLTFTADATTQFNDGATNVASTLNQIVKVEGFTKSDGTLFAKEVEGLESQTGSEVEGIVVTVTGNPAISLDLLAQDGIGGGMDVTKVGANFTADASGAQYKVDLGNIDTSGLSGIPGSPNFPFDSSTVMAGQRVEIESATSLPAASGTIAAEKVKLQQQALTGTVSNFVVGAGGATTFDLNLAADDSSYLTVLSAQTLVHVFQQPGTDNKYGAISNGSTLRVRGLLFWTGRTFNLIARRITP